MEYRAILQGVINNQEILVSGNGTIKNGLTLGNYLMNRLPNNFDPQILKGMLVTGYPNACSSIDGSVNVFDGHSYSYQRSLIFSNGNRLDMTAICELNENKLDSIFTVSGNVDSPKLISSEPLIESWEPKDNDMLIGAFKIVWKAEDEAYFSADARSIYSPGTSTRSSSVLHRYIEIDADINKESLSLKQNSKLFRHLSQL